MNPRKTNLLLAGTLLGIAYAAGAYAFLDQHLATISFLAGVPAALGFLPLALDDEAQIDWYRRSLFMPWLSVIGVLLLLFLARAESLLCLAILTAPIILVVTLVVWLVHALKLRRLQRWQRRAGGVALMLLPFALAPAEHRLLARTQTFDVTRSVTIAAPADRVWEGLVDVAPIAAREYRPGVLNALGVPRPVSAHTAPRALGGTRAGGFSDGLRFVETVVAYDPARRFGLDVSVDHAAVGVEQTAVHAFRNGLFAFRGVEYRLAPAPGGRVRLTLACRYALRTSVNPYGRLWADAVLGDFEERLLAVLRRRAESGEASPAPSVVARTW